MSVSAIGGFSAKGYPFAVLANRNPHLCRYPADSRKKLNGGDGYDGMTAVIHTPIGDGGGQFCVGFCGGYGG
jgi:hypothetical protein